MPTIGQWIGRLATNLLEPRGRIAQLMDELGGVEVLRSTEDAPNSVWVGEDQAPQGAAGYYVKRRVPIHHTIQSDGRQAVLQFVYQDRRHRISNGTMATAEANLRVIALLLESFSEFVRHGFMTWADCFLPFVVQGHQDATSSGGEWWRILRLPPDATPEEMKSAYRLQARKCHPDRGGSDEAFQRIERAYEEAKRARR